jgi:hypothetical protein
MQDNRAQLAVVAAGQTHLKIDRTTEGTLKQGV